MLRPVKIAHVTTKAELDAALATADQITVEGNDELLTYAVNKAAGDPANQIAVELGVERVSPDHLSGHVEQELCEAIEAHLLDWTKSPPSPVPPAAARPRRVWPLVLAAVVALLVLGLGGGLLVYSQFGARSPVPPPGTDAGSATVRPIPPPLSELFFLELFGQPPPASEPTPAPLPPQQSQPAPPPPQPSHPHVPGPHILSTESQQSQPLAPPPTEATPPPLPQQPSHIGPVAVQPLAPTQAPRTNPSADQLIQQLTPTSKSLSGTSRGLRPLPSAQPSEPLNAHHFPSDSAGESAGERGSDFWANLPALLWPLAAIVAIVALFLIARQAISAGSNVTIQWKLTEKVAGRVVITKVRERAPRKAA